MVASKASAGRAQTSCRARTSPIWITRPRTVTPLRLRVERQLGYKQAKYIMRIELVDSFAGLWGGNGGYWEDRGYEWYAGI